MKRLNIVHLGIGNVGREVMAQVARQVEKIEKSTGVTLYYIRKFTSKNSEQEIHDVIARVELPFVLIDTTAADSTVPYITQALKRGGFAVLANKKPLAGRQKDFDVLHTLGGQKLFYECVVGAGLPVIRPLKDFLMTGDEVLEIHGCFSGTLGYIFSQLQKGRLFSDVVREAKENGYTEPDPREDLSGKDVAYKALILARILGKKMELSDISLTGLYPKEMQQLGCEDFLKRIHELDPYFKTKVEKAKQRNNVLRFVATVRPKGCSVGLTEVAISSETGNLKGPENLIVIRTKRYSQSPLVIKGPGAGIYVTAAGVFADLLSIARVVGGTL
jgi:homoserine dehydrogenase